MNRLIALILLITCSISSGAGWESAIKAHEYGDKNSITLTNLTTRIGQSRKVRLDIDGGVWTISNNVYFSTNLSILVYPGSYLDIQAGSTVTVDGAWLTGPWQCFSNNGIATGDALFLYEYSQWTISNTLHDIGTGLINIDGSYDTLTASNMYVYTDYVGTDTIHSVDIADGTIGIDDLSTNIFAQWNTNGYMFGCPQLTLTTNMFSSDWEGATNFNFNTFTNIFDGNTNTFCNQAYLGTDEKGTLRLSLGGQYKGFVRSMPSINNIVSAQQTYLYATYHTYHYGYSQNYPLFGLWGPASWSTAAVGAWYQMWYVFPFEGSEIYFTHDCTTSGRGGVRYAVIEVYAVEVP